MCADAANTETPPALDAVTRHAMLEKWEQVLTQFFLRVQHDDFDARARSVLSSIAQELKAAGQALDRAAHVLKESGAGYEASQTKHAAGKALAAAKGITGE